MKLKIIKRFKCFVGGGQCQASCRVASCGLMLGREREKREKEKKMPRSGREMNLTSVCEEGEGEFKVVQIVFSLKTMLYFGKKEVSAHSEILEIALEENLGLEYYDEAPPCKGRGYSVIGMGMANVHPEFQKIIFHGYSGGYKINMKAADLDAIKAVFIGWEIVLEY